MLKFSSSILFISACLGIFFNLSLMGKQEDFPVLYKGRFRPADSYARVWLYDQKEDRPQFDAKSQSSLQWLLKLDLTENIPSDYIDRLKQLQIESYPLKQIALILEREYPPFQRIRTASPHFKALPGKNQEWFPLKALKLETYHKKSNELRPIANFTLYSEFEFEQIRQAYLNWAEGGQKQKELDALTHTLKQAYKNLAGTVAQEAEGKALYYPTLNQLRAEYEYYQYPWIKFLIFLYGTCTLLFIFSAALHFSSRIQKGILGLLIIAFLFHSLMLLWRVYILQRPPVSNMFETVIYVPWITVLFGLAFGILKRNAFPFLASSLATTLLLVLLELTHLNHSLDPVQAVLDSQFWLIIHVLMVVGSYGIFLLGSILGHFYLASSLIYKRKTPSMPLLAQAILQSLYAGTAFLTIGTLLGGVWAAESWGRFWDWDPKESWAFISICIYLIGIHAYRFQRIGEFGLAFGAVSGFLAISFTWYGVNYILGTGLHSYGFGSGGEIYYYFFLLAEIIFLGAALLSDREKIIKI